MLHIRFLRWIKSERKRKKQNLFAPDAKHTGMLTSDEWHHGNFGRALLKVQKNLVLTSFEWINETSALEWFTSYLSINSELLVRTNYLKLYPSLSVFHKEASWVRCSSLYILTSSLLLLNTARFHCMLTTPFSTAF